MTAAEHWRAVPPQVRAERREQIVRSAVECERWRGRAVECDKAAWAEVVESYRALLALIDEAEDRP